MMIWLLASCLDQKFAEISLDAIAVVNGDFDNVAQPMLALGIGNASFNGYIDHATWDAGDAPAQSDDEGSTVESLLTAADGQGKKEINKYNAVFVNSGTRGLNAVVYNYTLEADDQILADDYAMKNVCSFVDHGGTLVVSDWAYDLVEACFPDRLEWVGDDAAVDSAQLGRAGEVLADVKDKTLQEALGTSISLQYNYTAWAVMESVGKDVDVLVSGTVEYQPSDTEDYATVEKSPLMVRWAEGHGQVVVTTFHWIVQNGAIAQNLLLHGIAGMEAGAGAASAEVSGG